MGVCQRFVPRRAREVGTPHMRKVLPPGTHGWNRKAGQRAPRKDGFFQHTDGNGGREVWGQFPKNSGLPSMGRFSEELSSHFVSKIMG